MQISRQTKQVGSTSPHQFISSVRLADRRFRNTAHHDAQEFLNFLLHNLDETVQKVNKQRDASGEASVHSDGDASLRHDRTTESNGEPQASDTSPPATSASQAAAGNTSRTNGTSSPSAKTKPERKTFVHDIFCGRRVTHTRCMNCETQSQREETFMELTLNLEPDTTLEQCMLASRCAYGLGSSSSSHMVALFHAALRIVSISERCRC